MRKSAQDFLITQYRELTAAGLAPQIAFDQIMDRWRVSKRGIKETQKTIVRQDVTADGWGDPRVLKTHVLERAPVANRQARARHNVTKIVSPASQCDQNCQDVDPTS